MLPIVRTDINSLDILFSLINSLNKSREPFEEFESQLGKLSKREYNLIFPKLRYGMELTFKVLFHKKNIGVPTYTCAVVPHSVILSNNNVTFFDCNKDNLTSEKYMHNYEPYIVTPWYGSKLNNKIKHHENVFGDFAHVNILDNSKFLDNNFLAYFYSFSLGKPISSIGGGLVSTNNKELFEKLKKERNKIFGTAFKKFTLQEVLFSIGGSIISFLNAEKIKTLLDDHGFLNFLREDLAKISLGKYPRKLSYFQVNLLLKTLENNENNTLEIYKFWKNLLSDFPIEILNNDSWSNSHMNTRTNQRNKLKNVFNKIGIQTYFGSNYLNHQLVPYIKKHNNLHLPNSLNNFQTLLQFPINLSEKNFIKLQNKDSQIKESLESFFN